VSGDQSKVKTWRFYFVIAAFAVAVSYMIGYSFFVGKRISDHHVPLILAAGHVQTEITTAHLWFEEFVEGDPYRDTSEVFHHFRQADEFIRILQSTSLDDPEPRRPVGDDSLRRELANLQSSIDDLILLTRERVLAPDGSGIGSVLDEQYDSLYVSSISHAMMVEERLQSLVSIEMQSFRLTQLILLSTCLLLGILGSLVLHRYEVRRAADSMALTVANERLREDIELRERAEQGLQSQADLYRSTIDSLTHPFYLIDVETMTVKLANAAGLSAVGKTCSETCPTGECICRAGSNDCPVKVVQETGQPVVLEQIVFDADGSELHLETRAYPAFDSDNQVKSVIVYRTDVSDRRRAEQALRESETRMRSVLQVAPVGIGMETNGAIDWSNDGVSQITGYSANELVGMSFRALYETEDEYERVDKVDFDQLNKTGFGSTETQWICKDGSIRDVLLGSCVMHRKELANRTVFTAMDITERKKTEEERDRLYKYSSDMFCIAGFDGYYKQVNPAFTRILGWSKEEILARPWTDFVHEDDYENTVESGQTLIGGGELHDFVNRCRCKDGSYRWISWDSFSLPGQDSVFAVARDVTEKIQSEEALVRSELRFRSIIQASPTGIHAFRVGDDGELIFEGANPAADRILKINHSLLVDKTLDDAFPYLVGTEVPTRYNRAAKEGDTWSSEQMVCDGDRVVGAFHIVAFQTVPGHMVSMFMDITDRKRAEEERESFVSDLETKNAELERFTYTVSHDLKSPLITIRGFLGMIQRDLADRVGPETLHHFGRISNAAEKMQQLLDELLKLSRVSSMHHPSTRISLQAAAADARELVSGQSSELDIEIEISSDLPDVVGDRPRLVQLLQNLFDNAIKYMGDQPKPRVVLGCEVRNDGPVFYVQDNGIGIAPKYLAKIFDLFDKLDPASSGTGVGLALVRRIIELHDGKVWAESAGEGQGSTFFFTIGTECPNADNAPSLIAEGHEG